MNNTHWKDFFAGKTVTQMGLGLLGRGVNDALFLSEYCKEVIVTDLKSREELDESVQQLAGRDNITLVLGEHRLEDFSDRDFILRGAGVPLVNQYIDHAKAQNIPIYMDEALFSLLAPGVRTVGITGTRGKTTTTMLLYHILQSAQVTVHLGGNIRGIATLPLLELVAPGDAVLMELSSWQLQGFGDLDISPRFSAFTNFYDDHLDYYADDEDLYFKDKSYIYTHQKETDVLVLGGGLGSLYRDRIHDEAPSDISVAPAVVFDYTAPLSLIGEHNQRNIEVAAFLAQKLGISDPEIIRGIETFPGVEGRLEYMREVHGVAYFNDNNATTEDATLAAISALSDMYPSITLLFGGADKELSVAAALRAIERSVDTVIMLPGSGTDRIRADINAKKQVLEASSMQEAVHLSAKETPSGGVVILSPGFASFRLFVNEYDRNDQYVQAVSQL
ncbi:MAG: UDP-N-acetylmuramoylalanine--D-glutamate ligase [Planctomycetota bacterium]|jgi:UDP-N-acetylmuramoylalanine--D-glutamate ligase